MLAADKLLLRSTVKQRAIQLREKELLLFNDNFNAVGTQSAVLAGFAMTSFAEIDLPHNAFYAQKARCASARPALPQPPPTAATGGRAQACLHLFVTISICANLMCTASTTFVSVWGTGKALRGKDGSMDTAVDGMHNERAFIFSCFGVGLITTLLALMSAAWILMTLEVALVATLGISWCIFVIVRQARRIHDKFGLSHDDVVSFADIMQSPAVPAGEFGGASDEAGDETAVLIPSGAKDLEAKVRRGAYDV